MILYIIFFNQKWYNYINNSIIYKKISPKLFEVINYEINNIVNKNLPTIDKVIIKYIKYEAYNTDKKKDKNKNRK